MSAHGGKKSTEEFQEWLEQIRAQTLPGAAALTKDEEEELLGYNDMTALPQRPPGDD